MIQQKQTLFPPPLPSSSNSRIIGRFFFFGQGKTSQIIVYRHQTSVSHPVQAFPLFTYWNFTLTRRQVAKLSPRNCWNSLLSAGWRQRCTRVHYDKVEHQRETSNGFVRTIICQHHAGFQLFSSWQWIQNLVYVNIGVILA